MSHYNTTTTTTTAATTTTTNTNTNAAMFRSVQIPCCLCGSMIQPNAANQCAACLAQQFNLSEKLQRGPGGAPYVTIHQCRQCRRYQTTKEKIFVDAEPESNELLALCLKHIPALNNNNNHHHHPPIHLVDASFIWTEPHCMRFKVKLTVRTELQNVQVQQRCMVELRCEWRQCNDCQNEFTNRTWHAVVQLRQGKAIHSGEDERKKSKRGLAALEMSLAASPVIRKHVLRIDSTKNGFDFYFLTLPQAQTFAHYIQRIAPMRVKTSNKLVSTDSKNNTAHVKHTVTCDMVPLCRDDLILIHKSILKGGGKLAGRLSIVTKVSSVIHLVDGSPNRREQQQQGSVSVMDHAQMELSPETYYKNEKYITTLQSANRLIRFVVLDVELCDTPNSSGNNGGADDNSTTPVALYQGPASGISKYALADVLVARESDFGVNDLTYSVVTHLGHLLKVGDIVLGYDLETTVGVAGHDTPFFNGTTKSPYQSSFVLPDVILVRKVTEKRRGGGKNNNNDMDSPTTTAAAVAVAAENNDDEDHDDTEAATGKKISKRKERKRRKEQTKKMKELEEHAVRMGFLQDYENDNDDNGDHHQYAEDDDFEHTTASLDDEIANDQELAEQLQNLEKELDALGVHGGKDATATE